MPSSSQSGMPEGKIQQLTVGVWRAAIAGLGSGGFVVFGNALLYRSWSPEHMHGPHRWPPETVQQFHSI